MVQGDSTVTSNGKVTQTFTWNHRVQPTGVTVTGPGSTSLLTLNFYPCDSQQTDCSSGNNGNLWSQQIQTASGGLSVTQNYLYDHLNRLQCANEKAGTSLLTCGNSGSNWTATYGQDTLGNNWFNTPTGTGLPPLTAETPQSSGSYTTTSTTTAPNQIVGWTYDFNGNLIKEGSVARSFTYDAENRQVTANMNGTVSSYVYDGNGQRVSKTTGGVTTIYVYDAFGNEAAEYITANDVSPCGTPTCFVVEDHLGSTRMLTDSNGSGVRRYDYLPFGQELSAGAGGRTTAMGYLSAADGVSPKFTAQDRDQETSMDWFQVRYMDGAQGRFQSVDPGNAGANLGDPQTWNGYGYVGNNPLSYTDPSGMGIFGDIGSIIGSFFPGLGNLIGWGIGSIVDLATGQSISPPGVGIGMDIFSGISGSVSSGQPWNEQLPNLGGGTVNTGGIFGGGSTGGVIFSATAHSSGLPQNPSGLGPEWIDVTPTPGGKTNPKIPQRFRGPGGVEIEFDFKTPGKAPNTWGGDDHWHVIDPRSGKRAPGRHLQPGEPFPAAVMVPRMALPGIKVDPKAAASTVGAGVVLYWIISEGSRVFLPRNLIPIP